MFNTINQQMDAEEQKALTHLQEHRPEWIEPFLNHLERARQGILQRLLQAAVRENIVGLAERTVLREGCPQVMEVSLTGGKKLVATLMRTYSLGRFDLTGAILLVGDGRQEKVQHPAHLLDLIKAEGIGEGEAVEQQFARFRLEIQNSVANYALALAAAKCRSEVIAVLAAKQDIGSSLQWARRQEELDNMFSTLAFYEQWVVDGHPLHPGAKIKMGLEPADVIRYSPEFEATPDLVLLAVAKSESKESSLDGRTTHDILFAEQPGLEAYVTEYLATQGLELSDYRLVPVHPWQYEHTIRTLYSEALAQRRIVTIEKFPLYTTALMSFRTVAPIQMRGAGKHHIKTAVAIQTTGTMRTISPQSANNGPLVAGILSDVQERERQFAGLFKIMSERVGVYYDPSDQELTPEERTPLNKNLVAIFRENVENHLEAGELAMPGSAMLAESPLTGQPVVGELIEEFAAAEGMADRKQAAVAFMQRYAEVALPGFLTIMSRYGISLEGHLQNAVPVFKNGALSKMILRDFGGVRMLRERLRKQGLLRDFLPGSITITDDEQDVRNKIFYPVFQNHIGELIATIVRWSGVEEAQLWQPVIRVSRAVYAELKQDASIREQAADDEAVLFAPTIDLKAMATMRLLGNITTYSFSKVPNPMAGV